MEISSAGSSRDVPVISDDDARSNYFLPNNSQHFATNYNEANEHTLLPNKGNYLTLASINLGGERKSAEKNAALRNDLLNFRAGIITSTEYDAAVSLEGIPGWMSMEIPFEIATKVGKEMTLSSSLGISYLHSVVASHEVLKCIGFFSL